MECNCKYRDAINEIHRICHSWGYFGDAIGAGEKISEIVDNLVYPPEPKPLVPVGILETLDKEMKE